MISKAEARFLTEAEALRNRIEKGGIKDAAIIERGIGSLLKKHPRVQRYYKVVHEPGTPTPAPKSKPKSKPNSKLKPKSKSKSIPMTEATLTVTRDEAKIQGALELCGDYVLKTDQDMGAVELRGLYMTLLKAESGFRMLKGTLGLRPNFHQLEQRVEAHIFISVLAYLSSGWRCRPPVPLSWQLWRSR